MEKLLIICTGNTCRSPMAGALAGMLFRDRHSGSIQVKTAGLSAFPGSPASTQAVTVMKEKGLDLSAHQAQPVTGELVEWADLILTMTWEHKKRLLAGFPDAREKTFTLGEFGENNPAVSRAHELLGQILEKEQSFIRNHRQEMDRLLYRKQELEQELQEIRRQLADWESRLKEETRQETRELLSLEKELQVYDIPDPFGGTVDDYRQTAEALEKALEKVFSCLSKEN